MQPTILFHRSFEAVYLKVFAIKISLNFLRNNYKKFLITELINLSIPYVLNLHLINQIKNENNIVVALKVNKFYKEVYNICNVFLR